MDTKSATTVALAALVIIILLIFTVTRESESLPEDVSENTTDTTIQEPPEEKTEETEDPPEEPFEEPPEDPEETEETEETEDPEDPPEEPPEEPPEDSPQVCVGDWDTSACEATGMKYWKKNESLSLPDCIMPEQTEDDCKICEGSFDICRLDASDNNYYSTFKKTVGGDYCPSDGQKKSCKVCKAVLGDTCNDDGTRTYVWKDNEHDYDQVATTKYYCPESDLNKIGTREDSDTCVKCRIQKGDCEVDLNTGKFRKSLTIINDYNYCPQSMLDSVGIGEACEIPSGMMYGKIDVNQEYTITETKKKCVETYMGRCGTKRCRKCAKYEWVGEKITKKKKTIEIEITLNDDYMMNISVKAIHPDNIKGSPIAPDTTESATGEVRFRQDENRIYVVWHQALNSTRPGDLLEQLSNQIMYRGNVEFVGDKKQPVVWYEDNKWNVQLGS